LTAIISRELKQWILEHRNADPARLSLQYSKRNELDYRLGIAQIRSYQKAKVKIPEWANNPEIVWPPPLSIEQCSSEDAARFKSGEVHGTLAIDLTGGAGVDCYYLSKSFEEIVYVESDAHLCALAAHNFRSLGAKNIRVVHMRAEDFVRSHGCAADLIYVDPSRRPEAGAHTAGATHTAPQRKVFRIEDSVPDVLQLLPRLRQCAQTTMIKLSPLIDLSLVTSRIAGIRQLYVVAVGHECKEVLVYVGEGTAPIRIEAVHLRQGQTSRVSFRPEEERSIQASCSFPQRFLYEPNPALLKAGAFNYLAQAYGVEKLHRNTHLYTSADKVLFPGNTYRIYAVSPYSRKAFQTASTGDTYTIKTRNFPDTPVQIRRKLKIREGDGGYLFAVTLADNKPALLLCDKDRSQPVQDNQNAPQCD
jgi:precorrin-6B methylase 2